MCVCGVFRRYGGGSAGRCALQGRQVGVAMEYEIPQEKQQQEWSQLLAFSWTLLVQNQQEKSQMVLMSPEDAITVVSVSCQLASG